MYTKISKVEAKLVGAKRYFTGEPCRRGHIVERYTCSGNCVECDVVVRAGGSEATRLEPTARAAAKLAGMDQYFTGKPCKYGHIAARYVTNGICITCKTAWNHADPDAAKAYFKAYREANISRKKANNKAWYGANCEKIKVQSQARYVNNREIYKARTREYYIANSEAVKAHVKAYREANPEHYAALRKAWRAANPGKVRERNYRRRAQKAGGMTGAEFYDWINGERKVCFYCDIDCADNYHVDHIMPLSKGGLHVAANLVIACPSCNMRKGAKLPEDFLEELLRGTDP